MSEPSSKATLTKIAVPCSSAVGSNSAAGSCGGGCDGNALKYIQASGVAVESC